MKQIVIGRLKDALSGGQGNDFIDGRGQGTGSNPWENLNRAEYYEAPKTRYSVEPKTLNEIKTLVANTSDNIEFNAAITGSYLDSVSASDGFYLVTDSVASNLGGTGTDILVNIQQIEFNDGPMPLGLIIENQMDGRSVVAKFIEGTNYDDNVAKKAETKNINIRDKSGNDRLILGEGADC